MDFDSPNWWPAACRRHLPSIALAILAVLAIGNYLNWGEFRGGRYLNPYEFYHYYIGAKYAREVGYFDQYSATVVADDETGKQLTRDRVRNLHDYSRTKVKDILAQREELKAKFTPERWEEFKSDIAWFKKTMGPGRFSSALDDKGYNATPVWNMIARWLTWLVPTSNEWGMFFLSLLDLILLGLAFVAVAFTFGWRVAALGIILIGVHFTMSFSHFKGAFLRCDWVAACILGVCQLKRGHYKSAGAFLAYAALIRVFPLIFIGGTIGKALVTLLRTRRIAPRYVQFFAAYAATAAILVGVSLIEPNGLRQWEGFQEKISFHSNYTTAWRVGFKYLLVGASNEDQGWGAFVKKVHDNYEARKLYGHAIQALVLLLTVIAVRNLRDYEAAAMGFVPLFFLVNPAFYYYMLLIVPFFFFAPARHRKSRAIGLAYLYGTTVLCQISYTQYNLGVKHSWNMSLMFLALALYMLLLGLFERRQPGLPGQAAPAG